MTLNCSRTIVEQSDGDGFKAVFFDIDGTLVYFEATGMERGMKVLRELGLYSDAVAEAYRSAEEWFRGRVKTHLDRRREVFLEYNRLVLERLGIHEGLDELAEEIQRRWENQPDKVYPEVKDVLQRLKGRNLRLGVVSHRYPILTEKSLRRHGLLELFSCSVSPLEAEAPLGKLDPKLWDFALHRIGVKREEAVHVGDEPETDVAGAERAGLTPILVDRENKYQGIACLRIMDLTQLLKLV